MAYVFLKKDVSFLRGCSFTSTSASVDIPGRTKMGTGGFGGWNVNGW